MGHWHSEFKSVISEGSMERFGAAPLNPAGRVVALRFCSSRTLAAAHRPTTIPTMVYHRKYEI
jgi:hypothetical protein